MLKCKCKNCNRSWIVNNYFGLTIAICTMIVSITQIIALLLSIGWLEFIWNFHDNL